MIYLYYGSDEFARSEALATLRAAFSPDLADLNISVLEGRRLKLDDLACACEALPFLADRRLVIVRDALKHVRAGKERDELRTYLAQVPERCDLVFVENDEPDKRSSVFTYLKKAGQVVEFRPREGAELVKWLNERAQRLEVRLEPAAAQRLIGCVGGEGRILVTELGKLASYVGRGGQITPNLVDLLVQDQHEQNLFAFIDDLSLRRRAAALRSLRNLLAEGQAPTYIMFMLTRQVRILLAVQELAAERLRADEIATRLGQRPFVVRKALEQVRGFRGDELRRLHDRLLEIDHATKTGRTRPEAALDVLVLEVCGTPDRQVR